MVRKVAKPNDTIIRLAGESSWSVRYSKNVSIMIDIDEDLEDGILLLVDVHVHWLRLPFMIADELVVRKDEEKLVSTPA